MGVLTKKGYLAILLLIVIAFPAFALPARAVEEAPPPVKLYEQKIKAGLIYNFLKYTNWPQNISGGSKHLNVCVLGDDPFDGYLQPMQGRTAQQFVINIRRVENSSTVNNCQLLYIHRSQEEELSEVIQSIAGKNILTVSDIDNFSEQGGMVEFSTGEDQRIHLHINNQAAKAAGLEIQDRLLKLNELGK